MNRSVPTTVARRDPLRTYQFRLRLDPPGPSGDRHVAGVRSVSGLSWAIEAQETWSGGNNFHRYATPHRITWEPLILEHGIALGNDLEQWAHAARQHVLGVSSPLPLAKRDLVLEVWDPTRAIEPVPEGANDPSIRKYQVRKAWVSKYVALPKLDATASEVAIQTLEIIHEGWVRVHPPH